MAIYVSPQLMQRYSTSIAIVVKNTLCSPLRTEQRRNGQQAAKGCQFYSFKNHASLVLRRVPLTQLVTFVFYKRTSKYPVWNGSESCVSERNMSRYSEGQLQNLIPPPQIQFTCVVKERQVYQVPMPPLLVQQRNQAIVQYFSCQRAECQKKPQV